MAKDILTETFVALRDRLHLVACRLLGNEPEAEDAVQDTFCNIWSHSLPDTSPQARYLLFAVLKNVCLNKLKKRRLLVDIVNADVPVDERGFDESQLLRDCLLDSLPPVQRKVFELAVIEELEYEEIARELNMSDEAVRVNMSRARKKLREQYKKLER